MYNLWNTMDSKPENLIIISICVFRNNDVGASQQEVSMGQNANAVWHMMNCWNVLKFDTPNLNVIVKKECTCRF